MISRKGYPFFIAISSFIILAFSQELYAVSVAPIVHTLTQPDGTTFRARQWGDEWFNGWETEEGYTIVFDKERKSWTYGKLDIRGRLVSSFKRVGIDKPPLGISKHILPENNNASLMQKKMFSSELPLELPQEAPPLVGTGNIPVILVKFSDRTPTYTTTDFNSLLFGSGNYSMKDYYSEVSYGNFTVDGDVVGWYPAANTHDYYGANNTYGRDRYPGTLVREAVAAADAAGFNFAPYDQDDDGYVDVVAIIHQGTGEEEGSSSTDIWSHQWDLFSADLYGYSDGGAYTTNSNVIVNKYIIMPEILYGEMETIGVFTHEYGHVLGLPDLYDTDDSSEGIGKWSLMASGSWNKVSVSRYGERPAHLDAWSKYKLGWITPTVVSGTLTNEPISQVETSGEIYQLLSGTPLTGEYFLIENRQKISFDEGLPGSGLQIWHIDGNTISSKLSSNTVNKNECYPGGPSCATAHYGVALMQADNLWELEKNSNRGNGGDPYPGDTNNTAFTITSSPNSNLWNGAASNVSITDISASGSEMTATLSTDGVPVTTTTAPVSSTTTTTVAQRYYAFSILV